MGHITLSDIQALKTRHEPISMMTAYDYPFAKILDESGIDVILVGDSLANVVLGLESTRNVGMVEMVYHAQAVGRAVKRALVVGDMPFCSYQEMGADTVAAAHALIEAGCAAVKVEWFDRCLDIVGTLRQEGIAVMGHIGLTPQTADQTGGFKVRGKTADAARKLYDQARALEAAGCFALVLECVPDRVADVITKRLRIPTIGIGAGPHCDGQVLVLHDALGMLNTQPAKFVKSFCDIALTARQAIDCYIREVKEKTFPDASRSYSVTDEEFAALMKGLDGAGEWPNTGGHDGKG